MTKPIELERHQWNTIFERIQKTYPTSVWALRSKMKQRLGFVPREHKDWDEENHRWRMNCVMLDFYSEKHRTLFLMKYADVINDRAKDDF